MGKKKKNHILDSFKDVASLRYLLFLIQTNEGNGIKLKKTVNRGREFRISDIKQVKAGIEHLDNFDGWKNFNKTWDVMWIGLDIRYAVWIIARHNSPLRQLIQPIRLIKKHQGNVVQQAANSAILQSIPVPEAVLREREKMFKSPEAMKQLEQDEKVTEFLTGDVSAKITKEKTKKMLEKQLKELRDEDE